jgi:hypothetical protein
LSTANETQFRKAIEKISWEKKMKARKKRNRMQWEGKTVQIFLFLYSLFIAAGPGILYAALKGMG